MKLSLYTVLLACLFFIAVAIAEPRSSVVVSYPPKTPDSVLDQAKEAVKKAVCLYGSLVKSVMLY